MNSDMVVLRGLRKELGTGVVRVNALKGLDLRVGTGEFVSVVGPSGCGKSTLLGLIGGLDSPTDGQILIGGTAIHGMDERELTRLRNERIGFVFQSFHLIPTLSALENVLLPARFSRRPAKDMVGHATDLFALLGLTGRVHHKPNQLSGGEQQRVAIARALVNRPPLLLCDEPTGNLDSEAGLAVMDLLQQIRSLHQTTIIMVTHDLKLADRAQRKIRMLDGAICDDAPTGASL